MMSQTPSEERRKFVFVFTGPVDGVPGREELMQSVAKYARIQGWKVEMQLDLPLSAKVEIKEADDKPPADEPNKTK